MAHDSSAKNVRGHYLIDPLPVEYCTTCETKALKHHSKPARVLTKRLNVSELVKRTNRLRRYFSFPNTPFSVGNQILQLCGVILGPNRAFSLLALRVISLPSKGPRHVSLLAVVDLYRLGEGGVEIASIESE